MRGKAITAAFAFALALAACEYVPGTEAHQVEQAKRAVAMLLIDPASVQFRNVAARQGYVCGELNGRNKMGAFVGFKRFVVKLNGEDALIDPEFDYTNLISAEESCTALTGNSYASLSSSLSACELAAEQRAASILQTSFNERWDRQCTGSGNSEIFKPPLAGATPSTEPAHEPLAPADEALSDGAADEEARGDPDQTTNAVEPLVNAEGDQIVENPDFNIDLEPTGD